MNAGLQCLSHVDPFVTYFLSGQYKQSINVTNVLGCGGELAHTFAELQRLLWQSDDTKQNPEFLRERLARFAPHLFEGMRQQDVQEFLAFCLDGLHEDLNGIVKRPPPVTEEQDMEYERLLAEHGQEFGAAFSWLRHLEYNKSFLVDLLQGQLRSTVSCRRCKNKSCRFDPFLYLSLPVEMSMSKVTDALRKFLEEEKLSGREQWFCSKCKKNVDAGKKIDLWKLPPVLILHLKRFKHTAERDSFSKLDVTLQSPLVVDLKEYCSSSQKEGAVYELVCVANHAGIYGSGHYTATCRVGRSQWFHFNDENVSPLADPGDVMTGEAYVLFFQRIKDSALPRSPDYPVQTVSRPDLWPFELSLKNSVVADLFPGRVGNQAAAACVNPRASILEPKNESGRTRTRSAVALSADEEEILRLLKGKGYLADDEERSASPIEPPRKDSGCWV